MLAAIVASGDLAAGDDRVLAEADLVVAADGGADRLLALGRHPDLLVGDLDSVRQTTLASLEAAGVRVERHPADKEASDTALAIRAALAQGATEVVILGAMGGERLDHGLANVLILADPELSRVEARIVHGPDSVRLARAGVSLALKGRPGDLVTLLPAGETASGVTTEGLRWPLADAALELGSTHGLSNEIVAEPASVRLEEGSLFVIEHRTTQGDPRP